MNPDDLLYVMTGAVVVSAGALVLQALFLWGMYKSSKAAREQLAVLSGVVKSFVESTHQSIEHSRTQISEVVTKAGEVLDLTHKQLVRIDAVLVDATARAKSQMDRVELVLDDTITRFHETADLLNRGILRPVKEINAVASGIQAALSYLFRPQRSTVERATHDEEMFI